jgi:hypothetical protein
MHKRLRTDPFLDPLSTPFGEAFDTVLLSVNRKCPKVLHRGTSFASSLWGLGAKKSLSGVWTEGAKLPMSDVAPALGRRAHPFEEDG